MTRNILIYLGFIGLLSSCQYNKVVEGTFRAINRGETELALSNMEKEVRTSITIESILDLHQKMKKCGGVKSVSIDWRESSGSYKNGFAEISFLGDCSPLKEYVILSETSGEWKFTASHGGKMNSIRSLGTPRFKSWSMVSQEERERREQELDQEAETRTQVLKKTRIAHYKSLNIRSGDLIFQRGYDFISKLILGLGENSSFSHIGLVTIGSDGVYYVIDSTPNEGVRKVTIDEFIYESELSSELNNEINSVYRIDKIDQPQVEKIMNYLSHNLERKFDFEMDMSDDQDLYCTELVINAVQYSGIKVIDEIVSTAIPVFPNPVILPDSLSKWDRLSLVVENTKRFVIEEKDLKKTIDERYSKWNGYSKFWEHNS